MSHSTGRIGRRRAPRAQCSRARVSNRSASSGLVAARYAISSCCSESEGSPSSSSANAAARRWALARASPAGRAWMTVSRARSNASGAPHPARDPLQRRERRTGFRALFEQGTAARGGTPRRRRSPRGSRRGDSASRSARGAPRRGPAGRRRSRASALRAGLGRAMVSARWSASCRDGSLRSRPRSSATGAAGIVSALHRARRARPQQERRDRRGVGLLGGPARESPDRCVGLREGEHRSDDQLPRLGVSLLGGDPIERAHGVDDPRRGSRRRTPRPWRAAAVDESRGRAWRRAAAPMSCAFQARSPTPRGRAAASARGPPSARTPDARSQAPSSAPARPRGGVPGREQALQGEVLRGAVRDRLGALQEARAHRGLKPRREVGHRGAQPPGRRAHRTARRRARRRRPAPRGRAR
jgi:hypothetical protein